MSLFKTVSCAIFSLLLTQFSYSMEINDLERREKELQLNNEFLCLILSRNKENVEAYFKENPQIDLNFQFSEYKDKKTFLHFACEQLEFCSKDSNIGPEIEIITFLLDNKANPNIKDLFQCTPFYSACKYSDSNVLITKMISAHMKNKPAYINKEAQLSDQEDHLSDLVNTQNFQGDTPLHIACLNKFLNTAKNLLMSGANPMLKNRKQITPLQEFFPQCSSNQEYEIIDLCVKNIIKDKVNIKSLEEVTNKQGDTLLHCFVNTDKLETLRSLLDCTSKEYANKANKAGNTILHRAADRGKTELVNLLIEKYSVDSECKNLIGETAGMILDYSEESSSDQE